MQKAKSEIRRIPDAIESAFEVLGPVTKQRLSQHLMDAYLLDVKFATLSDISQIELAITELFGVEIASILIKQIYSEL